MVQRRRGKHRQVLLLRVAVCHRHTHSTWKVNLSIKRELGTGSSRYPAWTTEHAFKLTKTQHRTGVRATFFSERVIISRHDALAFLVPNVLFGKLLMCFISDFCIFTCMLSTICFNFCSHYRGSSRKSLFLFKLRIKDDAYVSSSSPDGGTGGAKSVVSNCILLMHAGQQMS